MGARPDATLRTMGTGSRILEAHQTSQRGLVCRDLQGEWVVVGDGGEVVPRGDGEVVSGLD